MKGGLPLSIQKAARAYGPDGFFSSVSSMDAPGGGSQ